MKLIPKIKVYSESPKSHCFNLGLLSDHPHFMDPFESSNIIPDLASCATAIPAIAKTIQTKKNIEPNIWYIWYIWYISKDLAKSPEKNLWPGTGWSPSGWIEGPTPKPLDLRKKTLDVQIANCDTNCEKCGEIMEMCWTYVICVRLWSPKLAFLKGEKGH